MNDKDKINEYFDQIIAILENTKEQFKKNSHKVVDAESEISPDEVSQIVKYYTEKRNKARFFIEEIKELKEKIVVSGVFDEEINRMGIDEENDAIQSNIQEQVFDIDKNVDIQQDNVDDLLNKENSMDTSYQDKIIENVVTQTESNFQGDSNIKDRNPEFTNTYNDTGTWVLLKDFSNKIVKKAKKLMFDQKEYDLKDDPVTISTIYVKICELLYEYDKDKFYSMIENSEFEPHFSTEYSENKHYKKLKNADIYINFTGMSTRDAVTNLKIILSDQYNISIDSVKLLIDDNSPKNYINNNNLPSYQTKIDENNRIESDTNLKNKQNNENPLPQSNTGSSDLTSNSEHIKSSVFQNSDANNLDINNNGRWVSLREDLTEKKITRLRFLEKEYPVEGAAEAYVLLCDLLYDRNKDKFLEMMKAPFVNGLKIKHISETDEYRYNNDKRNYYMQMKNARFYIWANKNSNEKAQFMRKMLDYYSLAENNVKLFVQESLVDEPNDNAALSSVDEISEQEKSNFSVLNPKNIDDKPNILTIGKNQYSLINKKWGDILILALEDLIDSYGYKMKKYMSDSDNFKNNQNSELSNPYQLTNGYWIDKAINKEEALNVINDALNVINDAVEKHGHKQNYIEIRQV